MTDKPLIHSQIGVEPIEASTPAPKHHPAPPTHFRVRTDKVDNSGRVTLRHGALLCHILIGRQHAGTKIRLYVANLDVRVITFTGEQLRRLTINPTKRYQGLNQENNYTPESSQCPR